MTKRRSPACRITGRQGGDVDQAGQRVGTPYRSESSTRKAPSLLFRQLRALALNPTPVRGFEHAFGDRPAGRGWWSPVLDGPDHHVRALRRRKRS
jgi:hypothetical protein